MAQRHGHARKGRCACPRTITCPQCPRRLLTRPPPCAAPSAATNSPLHARCAALRFSAHLPACSCSKTLPRHCLLTQSNTQFLQPAPLLPTRAAARPYLGTRSAAPCCCRFELPCMAPRQPRTKGTRAVGESVYGRVGGLSASLSVSRLLCYPARSCSLSPARRLNLRLRLPNSAQRRLANKPSFALLRKQWQWQRTTVKRF